MLTEEDDELSDPDNDQLFSYEREKRNLITADKADTPVWVQDGVVRHRNRTRRRLDCTKPESMDITKDKKTWKQFSRIDTFRAKNK